MDISEATQALMPRANVVGVGIGYKTVGGKLVRDENGNLVECIIVSVRQKVSPEQLSAGDMIPEQLMEMQTDVVETGPISIVADLPREAEAVAVDPKQRIRPILGGLSTGLNPGITAGTIGLLVKKPNDPNDYILSNWHVLAGNNTPVAQREVLTITQPGNFDGGRIANDVVAMLADFVPIQSGDDGGGSPPSGCGTAAAVAWLPNLIASMIGSNTKLIPVMTTLAEGDNLVDAALGRVTADFVREVAEIGVVDGAETAVLGMRVKKFGRTTSFTTGIITQVNATFSVQGYPNGAATFTDQIAITADSGTFLEGGDSGSSLISEDNKVVGLCFAGSTAIGIANRWEHVVAGLGIVL